MGALKIFGTPDNAHGYYSQHFSWACVLIDPVNVLIQSTRVTDRRTDRRTEVQWHLYALQLQHTAASKKEGEREFEKQNAEEI